MPNSVNLVVSGLSKFLCAGLLSFALSACESRGDLDKAVSSSATQHVNNKTKFSQKSYGVAASPRITTAKKVRKGGGRRQIGKPYKVRGKWYRPKEDFGYDRKGQASWYGPNFHGRLTANGEIYDQYALTAAHPTFPLPSYARVTNLDNGRSVVVRVNDRGPYHSKRIIDLSAKGAELLGYQNRGVGNVRVQYIKQAPLHGLDHKYLLASFRGNEGEAHLPKMVFNTQARPDVQRLDELSTGSVQKASNMPATTETGDPFLEELAAIEAHKDTGTTLALRLRSAPEDADEAGK